jgi:hypothetical protein
MMKKAIICGVCAVAFLLCLTPTIPAQQYRLVKNTIEKDFQQHLDDTIVALRCIDEDKTQIEYQKEILLKSFHEMKQIWELGGLDAVPTCFKFLIKTLLSLIFAFLGTILGIIFGKIFGPLLVFLVKVITYPARLLAKILEFIFDRNRIIAA